MERFSSFEQHVDVLRQRVKNFDREIDLLKAKLAELRSNLEHAETMLALEIKERGAVAAVTKIEVKP